MTVLSWLQDENVLSILKIVGAISTALLGVAGIWWRAKKGIYEKQLYNVYLPLFQKLEPILYCNITNKHPQYIKFASTFEKIREQHYELFFPSTLLMYPSKDSRPDFSSRDFIEFCKDVDKKFEWLRKCLFLPTRNTTYKVYSSQLPNKTTFWVWIVLISMRDLLLFFILLSAVLLPLSLLISALI